MNKICVEMLILQMELFLQQQKKAKEKKDRLVCFMLNILSIFWFYIMNLQLSNCIFARVFV